MYVPIEIAESGGETLRKYVETVSKYNEVDIKRDKIPDQMYKQWKIISEKMKGYLILDELNNYNSMFHESLGSRHPVKDLRDSSPLNIIYEVEEHLKTLRNLILDERETAIKKEKLEEEIKAIREKA